MVAWSNWKRIRMRYPVLFVFVYRQEIGLVSHAAYNFHVEPCSFPNNTTRLPRWMEGAN